MNRSIVLILLIHVRHTHWSVNVLTCTKGSFKFKLSQRLSLSLENEILDKIVHGTFFTCSSWISCSNIIKTLIILNFALVEEYTNYWFFGWTTFPVYVKKTSLFYNLKSHLYWIHLIPWRDRLIYMELQPSCFNRMTAMIACRSANTISHLSVWCWVFSSKCPVWTIEWPLKTNWWIVTSVVNKQIVI